MNQYPGGLHCPPEWILNMEPDDLVDNMIVWYGSNVARPVFEDYLRTYIELCRPDYLPMFLYKALFTRSRTLEFMISMSSHRVVICE